MTNRIENKNKLDSYQIITYVSFDLKKAFKEKCKQKGQSVSSVLRKFIIENVKE